MMNTPYASRTRQAATSRGIRGTPSNGSSGRDNYWTRPRRPYTARSGSRVVLSGGTDRPLPLSLESWQERYHSRQAKCPSCGRWRYMRLIQDVWTGGTIQKTRLQCQCGQVFTHDPRKHDHLLERTSGTGRRGEYAPRGYRRHQQDVAVYRG